MTTVAYSRKLGTISSDTLCIHNNIKVKVATKFVVTNRWLLAWAGCMGEANMLANKISNLHTSDDCLVTDINSKIALNELDITNNYLLFYKQEIEQKGLDGAAYVYAGGAFFLLEDDIKAIGSGAEFATSFMHLRQDGTAKAVEFASMFDVYTSCDTRTFDLLKWRYV
jgi:ATP-dependent protease HslVU (ClpYQ) peptidase subunit